MLNIFVEYEYLMLKQVLFWTCFIELFEVIECKTRRRIPNEKINNDTFKWSNCGKKLVDGSSIFYERKWCLFSHSDCTHCAFLLCWDQGVDHPKNKKCWNFIYAKQFQTCYRRGSMSKFCYTLFLSFVFYKSGVT